MGYNTIIKKYLEDEQLSKNEKLMIIVLSTFIDKQKCTIELRYEDFMKYTGIRRKATISACLKSLSEKGYISILKTGRTIQYSIK